VVDLGVEDLVMVKTDDAELVAHQERAQEFRAIMGQLEAVGAWDGKANRRIYWPWGSYDGLVEGERWQVNQIVVNSGASRSLQMHQH
jgi:mannose-1-phosphate guanylyltransferase / mannose-6-phosphate isomerase